MESGTLSGRTSVINKKEVWLSVRGRNRNRHLIPRATLEDSTSGFLPHAFSLRVVRTPLFEEERHTVLVCTNAGCRSPIQDSSGVALWPLSPPTMTQCIPRNSASIQLHGAEQRLNGKKPDPCGYLLEMRDSCGVLLTLDRYPKPDMLRQQQMPIHFLIHEPVVLPRPLHHASLSVS